MITGIFGTQYKLKLIKIFCDHLLLHTNSSKTKTKKKSFSKRISIWFKYLKITYNYINKYKKEYKQRENNKIMYKK